MLRAYHCWLFLLASILLEVSGTAILKATLYTYPKSGLAIMFVLICFSYFFLAKAVVKIPLGVAYAFWEGIGLCLITLVSVVMLNEHMDAARAVGLGMILCGTYLVHYGTDGGEEEPADGEVQAAEQGRA